MSLTKKYNNPPLVEALIDFRFVSAETNSQLIPGFFYERIKGDFDKAINRDNFELVVEKKGDGQVRTYEEKKPFLVQYQKEGSPILLQVGDKIFTVNSLKPYPEWDVFFSNVEKYLPIYSEIAKVGEIERVIVQYINLIEIPVEGFSYSEYFKFFPNVPKNLTKYSTISHKFQSEFLINNDQIKLTLLPIKADKTHNSFHFQIEYVINDIAKEAEVKSRIGAAHLLINDTFEDSLTDKCKAMFGIKK